MRPSARLDASMRHKARRARALRWILQDLAGVARQPEQAHRTHLRATLEWLCRAQDASATPGLAAGGWTFEAGWQAPSVDATGRLIETFLPAAEYLAWPELTERARRMRDALLETPEPASLGRLHGLVAAHVQLGDAESLARAVRDARGLYVDTGRTPAWHADAAHVLARLAVLADEAVLREAARAHLQAACCAQTPSGWFVDVAAPTPTAALARALRSLAEASRLLGDAAALEAALRVARPLGDALRADGSLCAAFDDGWTPGARHACVPGSAQVAAAWLRLAQLGEGTAWRDAAWRLLAWVKRCQRTEGERLALRGALPNAAPIWRGPAAFGFHTLGAKYFADALMMDMVGIAIPPAVQKAESA
ncbi:hypothetical protein Tbd_0296 [Thiobacillus denitrificans ATCC 25259]|uniref:Squalene cyclase C-terminal domain-containing protein n=1 Tax=Thiobacillus denitrificans (strain ATCC 25259 / T1) TaxID=292415 RepID=Q3SM03_THIDA|nr:hypothetical protein [Thiobacillus denitrificans]AAZ96249.1 hypothetical protein Tbd_0296 [Thiobacillus denitrificans ATCC 25259]